MSLIFDGGKAGEGGGGQTIQYNVMPTPTMDSIIQYTGETDANYTQGYFYQGVGGNSSATISQTTGNDLSNIAVNLATFETQVSQTGNYAFTYNSGNWTYNQQIVNVSDYGITYTATPSFNVSTGDSIGIIDASVVNTSAWQSQVSESGEYYFVFDGLDWRKNDVEGEVVDITDYGLDYASIDAYPPDVELQSFPETLDVSVDPTTFADMAGITSSMYTFTYNGSVWFVNSNDLTDEEVILEDWGISIVDGSPQEDDSIIISYNPAVQGPVSGDNITVDYSTGVVNGDVLTVVYTAGYASWQQINVQPSPEIATQTTVGGNTELSADEGVLVIETPDGTEEKQVANVEFVNNLVGDVASLLSEV